MCWNVRLVTYKTCDHVGRLVVVLSQCRTCRLGLPPFKFGRPRLVRSWLSLVAHPDHKSHLEIESFVSKSLRITIVIYSIYMITHA